MPQKHFHQRAQLVGPGGPTVHDEPGTSAVDPLDHAPLPAAARRAAGHRSRRQLDETRLGNRRGRTPASARRAAGQPTWQIVIIEFERRHRGIDPVDPRHGDRRLPQLRGNARRHEGIAQVVVPKLAAVTDRAGAELNIYGGGNGLSLVSLGSASQNMPDECRRAQA